MLIGLMRDSVMQCFCHTCRAPISAIPNRRQIPITKVKTKTRTIQPKRVQFVTTEVRCQEKTRGGLRYEVLLGEPELKPSPLKKELSPKNTLSVEDIQEKLRAAEERRQQIESNKIATWASKMQKIEEATRKKDEQTSHFITQTKEALNQKMETHLEKREAYISDLKTKLKDHIENVEKTRTSLDKQTEEVRLAMEEKLQSANALRDENIKKILQRLKDHEDQVMKVRASNTTKLQQLEVTVQEKLEHAQLRKAQLEQEQKEKLKNHEKRAEVVRKNKANILATKESHPSSG